VGLAAAIQFGVYQDFMMPIAAIIADVILFKGISKNSAYPSLLEKGGG